MKFKSTFIIFIILTLNSLTSNGQTPIIIPKEFVETTPPKVGSNEWYSLNYSQNEFGVQIINGKLDIKKVEDENKCELNISNGKLIGINNGEFGGSLTFIPSDKSKEQIEIKSGNIKFIFFFKDKIYFIEGLAHLTMSSGLLYELEIVNGKFIYKKLIDFEDSPEAFTIFQDNFLIATHNKFYIVKDFIKELVLQNTFWSGLYPNSIAALDEKNVFIGLRGGIVKIDLNAKTLKLYKNDK